MAADRSPAADLLGLDGNLDEEVKKKLEEMRLDKKSGVSAGLGQTFSPAMQALMQSQFGRM